MIVWNEHSAKSQGGTERVMRRIENEIDPELLEKFQVFPSRVRGDLDPTKIRIYHAHDTAEDPESQSALGDGRWRRFHRIVFVSHWQMNEFLAMYGIDWDRCAVLRNAIDPVGVVESSHTGPIRLIYTSTPQRGLDLLEAVFSRVADELDLELDVFSSFGLYGWHEADERFAALFAKLESNPRVRSHGARPNDEVRSYVRNADVFAYPSNWKETSCLCLMEAMSAGLRCVHPNLGALFETAGAMTEMYHWSPDPETHMARFEKSLRAAVHQSRVSGSSKAIANYAKRSFSWAQRAVEWDKFLRSLTDLPREIEEEAFVYRIGA